MRLEVLMLARWVLKVIRGGVGIHRFRCCREHELAVLRTGAGLQDRAAGRGHARPGHPPSFMFWR